MRKRRAGRGIKSQQASARRAARGVRGRVSGAKASPASPEAERRSDAGDAGSGAQGEAIGRARKRRARPPARLIARRERLRHDPEDKPLERSGLSAPAHSERCS
jgi:hypothetical protein